MVSKLSKNSDTSPLGPPGTTPEALESQMVSYAITLAEKQLREGTASAQVISHYLKLGSTRERLEQERLQQENDLLRAKVKQLADTDNQAKMYEDALRAMKTYQGDFDSATEEAYDEEYGDGGY